MDRFSLILLRLAILLWVFVVLGSSSAYATPEVPDKDENVVRVRILNLQDYTFPNLGAHVSVRRAGYHLPGLTEANFLITEETGAPFHPDSVTPIPILNKQIVLVLDHSVSQPQEWYNVRAAAVHFLEQLQPGDQAAVIIYGGLVGPIIDWTSPAAAIAGLYDVDWVYQYSVLHDAVAAGIQLDALLPLEEGNNRAIVVIADRPHTSPTSVTSVTNIAILVQQQNVPIYFYCYGSKQVADPEFETLVQNTGGFSRMLPNSTDLPTELDKLLLLLNQGYALLYRSRLPTSEQPTDKRVVQIDYLPFQLPEQDVQSVPGMSMHRTPGEAAPIDIYGIEENQPIAGRVDISIDANTFLPLRQITYTLNGQPINFVTVPPSQPITLTNANHILQIDIDTLLAECGFDSAGTYTLGVVVEDITRHKRSNAISFLWHPLEAGQVHILPSATITVTEPKTITIIAETPVASSERIPFTRAEFWLGTQLLGVDVTEPFTIPYPVDLSSVGNYTVGVRLTDEKGRVALATSETPLSIFPPRAPSQETTSSTLRGIPLWGWVLVALAALLALILLLAALAKQLEENSRLEGAIRVFNQGNIISDYGIGTKPPQPLHVGFPVIITAAATHSSNGNGQYVPTTMKIAAVPGNNIAFERIVGRARGWTRISQSLGSILRIFGFRGAAQGLLLPGSIVQRGISTGQRQFSLVRQVQNLLKRLGLKLPRFAKPPKQAANLVPAQATQAPAPETRTVITYLTEGRAQAVAPGGSQDVQILIQRERPSWRSQHYKIPIVSQPLPKNGTPPVDNTITVALGGFRKPHLVKESS